MSKFIASAGAIILWALAWDAATTPAQAAATDWVAGDHVRARLIAATDGVGVDGVLTLGIQMRLEEGWETYWRSPGDSGFPPKFDWSGALNLDEISVAWPAPRRFTILGMNTFGYSGNLVLPVIATVLNPSQPVNVQLSMVYAVCREVCFLVEQDFYLRIPPGPGTDDAEMAALIEQYQAAVPTSNGPNLAVERASVSGGPTPTIEILARATDPFQAPDVIIEAPPGFMFQAPTVRMIAGGRRAILRVPFKQLPDAEGSLAGNMVTVTIIDGDRAVQQTLPAEIAD
jgi:suppressor for copper-sensitivity B